MRMLKNNTTFVKKQHSIHQSSGQARRFAPMETCPERDKLDGHDHAMIGQTHPPLFTQNTVVSDTTVSVYLPQNVIYWFAQIRKD